MADVVTTAGREWLADLVDGTVTKPANYYIGSGTGAGTAVVGNTALNTEVSEARVAATMSQPSANINQFVATQSYTGTKTVTNAGVLTAITGGTLLVHGDFTGMAVANGDAIEFTVEMTYS